MNANQNGFSFLEIMFVICIVGIATAIALPTYFKQVQSARETEAITTIRSIIIFQQDYLIEHGNFATNDQFQQSTIKTETENYIYSTRRPEDGVRDVIIKATPKNPDLRGYIGAIALFNGVFKTVLCQSLESGIELEINHVDINKVEHSVECGLDTKPII